VRRCDRYLVLGSDGLYDVLKPKTVATICARGKHNAQRAAHDLMKAVTSKGCTDDTTIIVVTLELES
jgi:serine/threonine protein phosphatase PrpC